MHPVFQVVQRRVFSSAFTGIFADIHTGYLGCTVISCMQSKRACMSKAIQYFLTLHKRSNSSSVFFLIQEKTCFLPFLYIDPDFDAVLGHLYTVRHFSVQKTGAHFQSLKSADRNVVSFPDSAWMHFFHQGVHDVLFESFHAQSEAPLMDGILDVLQAVASHGWTVGVVTGSGQRPLINRLLKDFSRYLDEQHIVTAYDVTRGKPNPDPYLIGMEKAGTLPWQTIVVENAPLGVRAGVAARAFTIAVNTGPLLDETLLGAGADVLFHNMHELSDALTQK